MSMQRIVVGAVALGALFGSATTGHATGSPLDLNQHSEATIEIIADEVGLHAVIRRGPQPPDHSEAQVSTEVVVSHYAGEGSPLPLVQFPVADRFSEPGADWDIVDALPGPADLAGLTLPEGVYFVEDEDTALLDVAYTGSSQSPEVSMEIEAPAVASDGYEDR
jgi:hypothetical protein